MKKIIAYLLIFAMLFSLAVPVSAIDWGETVHDVIEYLSPAYAFVDFIKSGSATDLLESLSPAYAYRDLIKDLGGRPDVSVYPLQYATGGSGSLNFYGGALKSGADIDVIYSGIGSGAGTSYYKAVDPVQNVWYNPVTYNYSSTTNMSYSPTYSTYYIEDNEYKSYVIDNTTYISYYITETETGSTWYYEIYYRLPDGRYSYDLTAEDVWGTYFLYDAVNYDEVVEDDGTTLVLLHFDGNILDSSAHNNAVSYTANASYNFIDSDFTSALSWSDSTAHTMTVALPEPLSDDFTIEGRIKISDSVSNSPSYSNSSGKTISFSSPTIISESGAKNVAETRLGSGGTYGAHPTYPSTYPWVYTVNDTFYSSLVGPGQGILSLDGQSFFKGNGTYRYSYPAAQASYMYISYPSESHSLYFSVVSPRTVLYNYSQTVGSTMSFAFVRFGDTVTYYENGLAKYSFEYTGTDCETLTLKSTAKQTIVFDELRVSNKALYTDTYTPSSQPFDTNLVLVLPDQGELNQIAVKSNTAVADLRVGGVRPTYPSNGDVYVYLEEDVVKDVQQYQTDGWYSVDACIYEEDAGWTSFANYDLSAYVSEAPEEDDDGSGSGGAGDSGNTGDGSGDSSGGGDLNLGTDGILGELISAVFGGVVSAITAALQGLLSIFTALIEFTTGFGSFLRSAFVFIPGEIISVITAGITLMVILAIIKFIRG